MVWWSWPSPRIERPPRVAAEAPRQRRLLRGPSDANHDRTFCEHVARLCRCGTGQAAPRSKRSLCPLERPALSRGPPFRPFAHLGVSTATDCARARAPQGGAAHLDEIVRRVPPRREIARVGLEVHTTYGRPGRAALPSPRAAMTARPYPLSLRDAGGISNLYVRETVGSLRPDRPVSAARVNASSIESESFRLPWSAPRNIEPRTARRARGSRRVPF